MSFRTYLSRLLMIVCDGGDGAVGVGTSSESESRENGDVDEIVCVGWDKSDLVVVVKSNSSSSSFFTGSFETNVDIITQID